MTNNPQCCRDCYSDEADCNNSCPCHQPQTEKCDCETIAGLKAHTMECVFGKPQRTDWRDRLRHLYLSESPDTNGLLTASTTFTWGQFTFKQNNLVEKVASYLMSQDSLEVFIETELERVREEAYKDGREEEARRHDD